MAARAELNTDEEAIVELVREFVNREVKPVVRDLEHANTYPEKAHRPDEGLVLGLEVRPAGASAVTRRASRRSPRSWREVDEPGLCSRACNLRDDGGGVAAGGGDGRAARLDGMSGWSRSPGRSRCGEEYVGVGCRRGRLYVERSAATSW